MFGRDLVTAFQHDAVQNAIDRIEILGLPAIKFGRKYNEAEDDIVEVNAAIQDGSTRGCRIYMPVMVIWTVKSTWQILIESMLIICTLQIR